jgi:hypothetical protein
MNQCERMFRHNSESFKKMWDEVGEATGTKWRVESQLIMPGQEIMNKVRGAHGDNVRRLKFSVFLRMMSRRYSVMKN